LEAFPNPYFIAQENLPPTLSPTYFVDFKVKTGAITVPSPALKTVGRPLSVCISHDKEAMPSYLLKYL
jgi:hypothetical protein